MDSQKNIERKFPNNFVNKIICGDCLEVMKGIPDDSIDTIITDPPYGLEFMGKNWDKFKRGENIAGGNTGKDTPYARSKPAPAFYQLTNEDKLSYQAFTYQWAKETLRVAKPGTILLCFGGTRTFHRLACAIEDAGWQIRDTIMWIYGSGFPKSHNVANAIDKKLGKSQRGHAISSGNKYHPTTGKARSPGEFLPPYKSRTKESKKWQGYGTALKPAYEPIVVAMKSLDGTYAENALKHEVAGLNIDGGRIDYQSEYDKSQATPQGKPTANIAKGARPDVDNEGRKEFKRPELKGRFPANIILDEEAAKMLDEQSGVSKTRADENYKWNKKSCEGATFKQRGTYTPRTDTGGASRFFYVAKASKQERNMGCENIKKGKPVRWNKAGKWTNDTTPAQNNHPTVKPLRLMEYLCVLTRTPTGGIVLDPFIGSGTTAMACKKTNRPFIGIEKEKEYCIIAEARIKATPLPPQSLGI